MVWLGAHRAKIIESESDLMEQLGLKSEPVSLPVVHVPEPAPIIIVEPVQVPIVESVTETLTVIPDISTVDETPTVETVEEVFEPEPLTDPNPVIVDPPATSSTVDLTKKTKSELVAIAVKLGLDSSGSKSELYKRISQYQAG